MRGYKEYWACRECLAGSRSFENRLGTADNLVLAARYLAQFRTTRRGHRDRKATSCPQQSPAARRLDRIRVPPNGPAPALLQRETFQSKQGVGYASNIWVFRRGKTCANCN